MAHVLNDTAAGIRKSCQLWASICDQSVKPANAGILLRLPPYLCSISLYSFWASSLATIAAVPTAAPAQQLPSASPVTVEVVAIAICSQGKDPRQAQS